MSSAGKTCVVCQAPAHSVNYGAVTCEACKSFFRRANRGAAYKNFRCLDDFNCPIDEVNRNKSCSYCRFQRCLKSGMSLDRFKTEQEKVYFLTRRRARHTSPSHQHGKTEVAAVNPMEPPAPRPHYLMPKVGDLSKVFSMMELFDLDSLWSKYSHSFHNVPVSEDIVTASDPYNSIDNSLEVLSAIAKRLLFFSDAVPQFAEFSIRDRKNLFVGAMSELCLLNACLAFNKDDDMWIRRFNETSQFYKNLPSMTTKTMVEILGPEIYGEKLEMTLDIQRCRPDEITIMLLFCILLFTPTRSGLRDTQLAQQKQHYFASLLKKYLVWGFGVATGLSAFRELVTKLRKFRKMGPLLFEKLHGPMLQHAKYNFLGDVFPGVM